MKSLSRYNSVQPLSNIKKANYISKLYKVFTTGICPISDLKEVKNNIRPFVYEVSKYFGINFHIINLNEDILYRLYKARLYGDIEPALSKYISNCKFITNIYESNIDKNVSIFWSSKKNEYIGIVYETEDKKKKVKSIDFVFLEKDTTLKYDSSNSQII